MDKKPLDKAAVLEALCAAVEADLRRATESQRATHAGATHEESRAENAKDTRALEASYLARGLAARVAELQAALHALRALSPRPLGEGALVSSGALVVLEDEEGRGQVYLLAPLGGGARATVSGVEVRVVTPKAPLGEALLGKRQGDDFELRTPQGLRERFVASVI